MTDKIRKLTALAIAAVFVFCFASCSDDGEEDTTTTSSNIIYTLPEESTTAPAQEKTTKPKKNNTPSEELSTLVLTTIPGGEIPTVVTSQWNTTLPSNVTPVQPGEITTIYLTVPGGYVTVPTMPTQVAVTTTEPVATTASTTNSLPTTDVITQIDPNGQTVTVYSSEGTTVPAEDNTEETGEKKPQPVNLVESGSYGFDSSGAFVVAVMGDGLPDSFKVTSAKLTINVNGEPVKNISVTASSNLNEDGELEIVLKTNSSQIQSGDIVQFTLPEGFIKANDGLIYSNEKAINAFAP